MADRRLRFTGPGIWYRSTSLERELPQQEARHVLRAVARGLQAHGRAVAAMRQLAFERAPQVVDFFLVDEQVAVARDAELIAAEHVDAREELAHERMHDRRTAARTRPAPLAGGAGTTRGSERGACTMASSLSRPNASLPCSRTMKLRLLFWMRGNGRAGSRPSGLSTGSTSRSKYSSSQRSSSGVHVLATSRRMPFVLQRRQQHLVEAVVLVGHEALRARS